MSAPADRTVGALAPKDTEWAAKVLRYLGTQYPECLDALRASDEHEVRGLVLTRRCQPIPQPSVSTTSNPS